MRYKATLLQAAITMSRLLWNRKSDMEGKSVIVETELHKQLLQVKRQSGRGIRSLVGLAIERLLDEVREKGRLPEPAVKLEEGAEV